MQAIRARRPAMVYVLMLVLLFLSVGALYGGYHLLTDPSGGSLGMPIAWLEPTGFSDYFIPGLILFTALGVLPLGTVFLLGFQPEWRLMRGLEHRFHVRWVWGLAFGTGLAQIVWIVYQVATMGLTFFLQPLFFGVGLVIAGVCWLPSVRHYYWA